MEDFISTMSKNIYVYYMIAKDTNTDAITKDNVERQRNTDRWDGK